MNSKEFINELSNALEKHRNPDNAFHMKKYMRDQYDFFGIKAPLQREITKPSFAKSALPEYKNIYMIVKTFWSKPEREYQHVAMELVSKYVKEFDEKVIELLEFMITNKSWWDTVDYIAAWLVGGYFKKFPGSIKPITGRWIESDNIWLQRSAILFQLKYKSETDTKLLFKYINQLKHSKEFFIRKAIGWALREYSKTDPETVVKFVDDAGLEGLSKREALKRIK